MILSELWFQTKYLYKFRILRYIFTKNVHLKFNTCHSGVWVAGGLSREKLKARHSLLPSFSCLTFWKTAFTLMYIVLVSAQYYEKVYVEAIAAHNWFLVCLLSTESLLRCSLVCAQLVHFLSMCSVLTLSSPPSSPPSLGGTAACGPTQLGHNTVRWG